jgi:hypothetical protein
MAERRNAAPGALPPIGARLRRQLTEALADDAERLRELTGQDFPAWTV